MVRHGGGRRRAQPGRHRLLRVGAAGPELRHGRHASAQILADVNVSRAQAVLPGLAPNGQLTCLAQSWSAHMGAANGIAHQDLYAILHNPSYGPFHTLGENVLTGPWYLSAADIHTAWMNFPLHRANILSGSFSPVGIGLAYANGQVWATEDFGG
jgi:uncharacterized protein YkwD